MNELETYVLQKIGEDPDSPDVFSDTSAGMAPIRDSINDAIEEICVTTGMHTDNYYLALKQDRGIYKFTPDRSSIAWITDVWYPGQKRRLNQTDIHQLNAFNPRWMINTGTPQLYYPVGFNYIGFWPKPSSDSDIIEVKFAAIPDRYASDTDRIRLKKSFKWAVVDYAVSEYYAGRGDARTAKFHHQNYVEKVMDFLKYPMAAENTWQYQTAKAAT